MKTLVIGASAKPERYSYQAIERLKVKDYPVVALGLKAGVIQGEIIHTTKEIWTDIDTVSLYVGPAHQDNYIDYIIGLNPRRVLFNPGTENPDFYRILKSNHISYFEACTLVLLSTNQY